MLSDDDTLEEAVSELIRRFDGVIKIQIGKEVWQAPEEDEALSSSPSTPDI